MGILCVGSSGLAGVQDISDEDAGGLCPAYVVVYVQSKSLVGTVSGMGVWEEGPVLLLSKSAHFQRE